MMLNKKTDEELLLLVPTSQKKMVLTILYKRYEKKVYYKALTLVKDKQTAQDLTHDIFIKIFTKLSQFKGTSPFSLWVHSIAVNTCLSHLKKNQKIIFQHSDSEENENIAFDETSEERMLKEIKLDKLQELIRNLDQGDRLLLTMKYVDGMSIKEMENILNLGGSAIKMRLKRIRDRILSNYNQNKEQYEQ